MIVDLPTILIACLTFVLVKLLWTRRRQRNLPPGPWPWPFVGNVDYYWYTEKHFGFERLTAKYGPIFTIYYGQTPVVYLETLDAVREAFVKLGSNFTERPNDLFTLRISNRGGYGVAWSNGELWVKLRRMVIQSMKDVGAVREKLEASIHTEITHMVPCFEAVIDKPFQPGDILQHAVSNIVSTIVFGSRFEYDDPLYVKLQNLMRTAFRKSIRVDPLCPLNFNPILQLPFKVLMQVTSSLKETGQFVASFNGHSSEVIAEHKQDYDEKHIRDLIDVYIRETASGDPTQLINNHSMNRTIFDIFFAGTETTSLTLSWSLLYMIAYPDVQEKCAQQIGEAVGFDRDIMMSDADKLPYVLATISEVQRISPVAPLSLPHRAKCDVKLGGYDIPKETIVIADIYGIHHSDEYWTNPSEFDPNHFLDSAGKFKHNKAFIPFSVGPRMCLGDSMARTELFLFFSTIIQRFSFSRVDGEEINFRGNYTFAYDPPKYNLLCRNRVT